MTLWGGRFAESPEEALWAFTVDHADRRLLEVDLLGSVAHVRMLGEVGLLTDEETEVIVEGLDDILTEAREGTFAFRENDEDVHSAVERRLYEMIGATAGKLHTGRSRNDQIALDIRLYLTRSAVEHISHLEGLIETLIHRAEEFGDTVVPMYTHLQQAQAISFGQHLLAYAWMLLRDVDRGTEVMGRLNVSPLGAGAGGGSGLPLDPRRVADLLQMPAVFDNSLDAVGSRDVVAEYVFFVAQTMTHLSRLAEEMVLWATSEFDWVTYADRYTTGSSALPQKKNPDIAELVRGRTATVIGDVTALLALQKGLPLAYNRDLQEDKVSVFHADDVLSAAIPAVAGMLASAVLHPPEPIAWVTALDLAEVLVQRGVPFREAHEAVGRLVAKLVSEGRDLTEVTAGELQAAHLRWVSEDLDLIDPKQSVARRRSVPTVAEQIARLRSRLVRRAEPDEGSI